MTNYARDTTVSPEQTLDEIATILARYGGHSMTVRFDHASNATVIQFILGRSQLQISIPLPWQDEFAVTPQGKPRTTAQARSLYQQAVRARHRALKLLVQAQLEAAALGITGIEQHTLLDATRANNQLPASRARAALPQPDTLPGWITRAVRMIGAPDDHR